MWCRRWQSSSVRSAVASSKLGRGVHARVHASSTYQQGVIAAPPPPTHTPSSQACVKRHLCSVARSARRMPAAGPPSIRPSRPPHSPPPPLGHAHCCSMFVGQRVKSVSMGKFTNEEMLALEQGGNAVSQTCSGRHCQANAVVWHASAFADGHAARRRCLYQWPSSFLMPDRPTDCTGMHGMDACMVHRHTCDMSNAVRTMHMRTCAVDGLFTIASPSLQRHQSNASTRAHCNACARLAPDRRRHPRGTSPNGDLTGASQSRWTRTLRKLTRGSDPCSWTRSTTRTRLLRAQRCRWVGAGGGAVHAHAQRPVCVAQQ